MVLAGPVVVVAALRVRPAAAAQGLRAVVVVAAGEAIDRMIFITIDFYFNFAGSECKSLVPAKSFLTL